MTEPLRIEPLAFYSNNALALMGLSCGAIARARRRGELRYTRRAGRTLYLGAWLLDWLAGTEAEAAHAEAPVAAAAGS